MILHGAKIYSDGVRLADGSAEKVHQIVNLVKILLPDSEVRMRLIKNKNNYEGLLWVTGGAAPIGAYNRAATLDQMLDNLYQKVKKECLKFWKRNHQSARAKTQPYNMVS